MTPIRLTVMVGATLPGHELIPADGVMQRRQFTNSVRRRAAMSPPSTAARDRSDLAVAA